MLARERSTTWYPNFPSFSYNTHVYIYIVLTISVGKRENGGENLKEKHLENGLEKGKKKKKKLLFLFNVYFVYIYDTSICIHVVYPFESWKFTIEIVSTVRGTPHCKCHQKILTTKFNYAVCMKHTNHVFIGPYFERFPANSDIFLLMCTRRKTRARTMIYDDV